jgi:ABC-type multidrug transport system permease subunit
VRETDRSGPPIDAGFWELGRVGRRWAWYGRKRPRFKYVSFFSISSFVLFLFFILLFLFSYILTFKFGFKTKSVLNLSLSSMHKQNSNMLHFFYIPI